MYFALKAGAPVPWDYWHVTMCERFGWSWEYWDELDSRTVHTIIAVWAGVEKAEDAPPRQR